MYPLTTFVELVSRLKNQNDDIHEFDAPIFEYYHLLNIGEGGNIPGIRDLLTNARAVKRDRGRKDASLTSWVICEKKLCRLLLQKKAFISTKKTLKCHPVPDTESSLNHRFLLSQE